MTLVIFNAGVMFLWVKGERGESVLEGGGTTENPTLASQEKSVKTSHK